MEEIEKSGFGPYYIDHTVGVWPQAAGGIPFNACEFQSKGDPVTDLFEDLAAEQKARSTYDNILRVVRDIPEIADPIKFLRAREIVHFQRFGEAPAMKILLKVPIINDKFRDLEKRCGLFRRIWMQRISMPLTPALIIPARRHVKTANSI